MSSLRFKLGLLAAAAVVGVAVGHTLAIDVTGQDLNGRYAGFSRALQLNATGYGNASITTQNGVLPGSELNQMFISADADNLWIGLTGNLPSLNANGESMIILLQTGPGVLNVLETAGLPGDGGGHASIRNLSGLALDTDFAPEYAIVVNRAGSNTYANAWDLATNFAFEYLPDHTNINPFFNCTGPIGDCITTQPCLMSAWIDATNINGVDDNEALDGTGPGSQEDMADSAVKGLRLRLNRTCFAIGNTIKIMAVIASPDGTMSNQILPPIPQGEDPAAPLCYAPTSRPDLSLITGDQYATVDLTMRGGTPTTPGQNGSNIPAGWAAGATMDSLAGTAVATQQLHTCYGNAVPGVVTIITAGSELDQLYVRNDDQYLYIAVPGNLEGNGNRCNIFIDSIPMVGENTLDSQGLDDGFNSLFRWNGRKFDAAFAPDFAYVVNNSGGRLYADYYNLATDIKTYLGSSQVDSATGTLDGSGTNPNSDQFALDNSNGLGVVGFPTTLPVDPTTATLGLECKIALTELSANACSDVQVLVVLGNPNGEYLSNQFLPSLAANTGNINNDPVNKFNFGSTDTMVGGNPGFAGDQFVLVELRKLGELDNDPNCCLTASDIAIFVNVLVGLDTDPGRVAASNVDGIGGPDGRDIQVYLQLLQAQGPCP